MFLIDSYRYVAAGAALIDYLIVGGASGGAGSDEPDGPYAGGGGDVVSATNQTAPAIGSYSVVRGSGVSGNGIAGNSSFNGITAQGDQGQSGTAGLNAGNYNITGTSLDYGTTNTAANASRGRGTGAPGLGLAMGENGCVIIRYLTGTMTATGGTITTSGGYTIHTFTSNGTWQRTA